MREKSFSVMADMGKILRKNVNSLTLHPEGALYVLDGGWLLRKVTWTQNVSTCGKLCQNYVNYVKRKFGSRAVVIFDGRENEENSTKAHEHRLRSFKYISREIHFDLRTTVNTSQGKFVANSMNKVRLINFLKLYFEKEGFHVKQGRGDADSLIVSTSLKEAANFEYPVVTVGNDTDLQVALTTLADPTYDLYVVREIEPVEISKISDIQGNVNEKHRKLILFTFCFSGCDRTSAPFKKGKGKVIAALNKLNE